MPSRTLEDKVDDLMRIVSGQIEQINALKGQLSAIDAGRGEVARQVTELGKSSVVLEHQIKDLRSWRDGLSTVDQLKVDLALLNREIEELKRWQEEVKKQQDKWGNRWWGLVTALIIASAGVLLNYYFKK